MGNSKEETARRLKLVDYELTRFRDIALGVILAGSVAYSPNCAVTEKSDLDLVVIIEDLKSSLPIVMPKNDEKKSLYGKFCSLYDIYTEFTDG